MIFEDSGKYSRECVVDRYVVLIGIYRVLYNSGGISQLYSTICMHSIWILRPNQSSACYNIRLPKI